MSRKLTVAAVLAVMLTAACTSHPAPTPTPAPTTPSRVTPRTAMPAAATSVAAGSTAPELAIAASQALFTSSPAVVLAALNDATAIGKGATTATTLGVPLLLSPPVSASPPPSGSPPASSSPAPSAAAALAAADPALQQELGRLAPQTVVTVGDGAAAYERVAPTGRTVAISSGTGDDSVLPSVAPAPALSDLMVLAVTGDASVAAVATAKAAGAQVVMLAGPDPRATSASVKAIAGKPVTHVLGLGSAFGSADILRSRVDTAVTGVELPGGGQVVFPGRRMVALYGHPGNTVLGVLGEQPLDATIARAKQTASAYSSLVQEPVIPAFDLIATVASASAGPDGNYSNESPVSELKPWVDAAKANGVYVVLDLQPGRTDFLTQAKLYADLLLEPNVGLALDPEWRLKPNQVHLQQIGSVGVDEINATGAWLADLTRSHNLPQKVFMVHQFRLDMIQGRSNLQTNYDQLRVVIHADGFGTPGAKNSTWDTLHQDPPANILWGWKNFYDEDKPTFTPAQTMAQQPTPVFVSYQ
jgi:hypothetical protein